MLLLLVLLSTINAAPQAAYQLFDLSPFRLDFSAHQIQAAHFQGTKRSVDAKGAHVLLLLPQEPKFDVNLTNDASSTVASTQIEQNESTTLHPKVLELKEKADVIVSERAEKQKEKYHFDGRWEENFAEGSGDEAEAETRDSVVEMDSQGVVDVETQPLSEKETTKIESEIAKKPVEKLNIVKKSSKNSKKSESVDEITDEIEKKLLESEGKTPKNDDKELKLAKNEPKNETKEDENSIPIPEKIEEIIENTTKKVDNEAEETTTESSKFSKQFWPTEVVIEGREFYLLPKNGRARDYLEPSIGGGYLLKKTPQDWFRGLHEQLRRETQEE